MLHVVREVSGHRAATAATPLMDAGIDSLVAGEPRPLSTACLS